MALKRGILTVKYYNGAVEILSTELDGELEVNGKVYSVIHGQTLRIDG